MRLRQPVFAAIVLVGALCLTLAAFGAPVLPSLQLMIEGSVGDKFAISRTLVKSIPLVFTGLGMVVAWRSGMYNIGGEGQFIAGGLASAWLAVGLFSPGSGVPLPLATVALLVVSVLGGAVWAGIAGWLRVKRGVEIVISTILLNFIAVQLLGYAVSGPLQERKRELPLSEHIPAAAMLPKFDRQADLHYGIFLAIAAAIGVSVWMSRTRSGFRMRLVGASPRVARANRIDAGAVQFKAILLSGGICGLAGGVEFTGMTGQIGGSFSQQWGFIAIPVALIAGLHPLGVLISALYFGAVFAGSENLARFSHSGTTLIYVVQAVAVLALVALQRLVWRPVAVAEAA